MKKSLSQVNRLRSHAGSKSPTERIPAPQAPTMAPSAPYLEMVEARWRAMDSAYASPEDWDDHIFVNLPGIVCGDQRTIILFDTMARHLGCAADECEQYLPTADSVFEQLELREL